MAADPWTAAKTGAGARVGDEYSIERVIERARKVSTMLRRSQIHHAIAGGLAVHALVWEVDGGSAHTRGNIDILVNRADLEQIRELLKATGRESIDLQSALSGSQVDTRSNTVRLIISGEKLRERYSYPTPKLEGHYSFPSLLGFECLLLEPLLMMKLTSFRCVDMVHIQDLLEEHLITPKIEAAMPAELQARLKQIVETTEKER